MTPQTLLKAGVAAFSLSTPAVGLTAPNASWFVGDWTCAAREGGESFRWRVSNDMPGGWLVGHAEENGEPTSIDVWAYDDSGELGIRLQFSSRGAIIELDSAIAGDDQLELRGEARFRDGRVVPLRERINFLNPDRFAAVWEADEGSGFEVVVDEICEK